MKKRDPKTPAEWQEAVDAAHCMRAVHDAILYGLVTGPEIDAARCDWILDQGAKLGFVPRSGVLGEFVRGLAANGGSLYAPIALTTSGKPPGTTEA